MTEFRPNMLVSGQRIGQPQLDESLTTHADPFGFLIYGIQQVNGKVYIHPLNLAPRTYGMRKVEMCRKIFSRIVHFIQTSCGQCASPRGSALLLLPAHGGPR